MLFSEGFSNLVENAWAASAGAWHVAYEDRHVGLKSKALRRCCDIALTSQWASVKFWGTHAGAGWDVHIFMGGYVY